MMSREERERMRRAAAERALERGDYLQVQCPACGYGVAVPFTLSVHTIGGRLVHCDLHSLPLTHDCPSMRLN